MNSTKAAVSAIFARSDEVEWEHTASGVAGVSRKVLRYDQETGALAILLKFEAGASYPLHNHLGDEEIYLLEGDVRVGKHELKPGDYLYTPPEGKHAVSSQNGCLAFLRVSRPV